MSTAREHVEQPTKRRKLSPGGSSQLRSLNRDVSPPAVDRSPGSQSVSLRNSTPDSLHGYFRKPAKELETIVDLTQDDGAVTGEPFNLVDHPDLMHGEPVTNGDLELKPKVWSSPFKLTRISNLGSADNHDTVGIRDILGDVMLQEVWIFNYMHDIPWVMDQFDSDIRAHVKVVFVHGNWKREDASRLEMEEEAKRFPNIRLVAAYMPEMYGTHHTKLMVLFRRDDLAQIVVHTANMIPFDWGNMTQAAWISPLLPPAGDGDTSSSAVGAAFKRDITSYLVAYGASRTRPLVEQLRKYSFAEVKAVFIASVPGKHSVSDAKFGWPKLARSLSRVKCASSASTKILVQISSIATLGVKDTWLTPVFFRALAAERHSTLPIRKPEPGIIYPSVLEITQSLNGYRSGSSIHLRLGSEAQTKQMAYLKTYLHHWSSPRSVTPPGTVASSSASAATKVSGREEAAPHIKTYIRLADKNDPHSAIDWALVTSANLSTQAWGAAEKDGTVRVCSYEAGVLVYPGLFDKDAVMKPAFKKDRAEVGAKGGSVVSLRMPYGLPVRKYEREEAAWSPNVRHTEIDRFGNPWPFG